MPGTASLMRRRILFAPFVITVLLLAGLYTSGDATDLSRAPGTSQQSIAAAWHVHTYAHVRARPFHAGQIGPGTCALFESEPIGRGGSW